MAERTENDTVADLAVKAAGKAEVIFVVHDGINVPLLTRPTNGGGIVVESLKKSIDEYRIAPERKKGTANLVDLASFVNMVNRFKDDQSALFAAPDDDNPRLVCVFNYNEPTGVTVYDASKPEGQRTSNRKGEPRFGDHRAAYTFPVSEEWEAWTEQNGQQMAQEAFASFIEDRLLDVADPRDAQEGATAFASKLAVRFATPQKLLELSRGLTISVEQRITNNVKLASGEGQILFSEEHGDGSGKPLDVPGAFIIHAPVFEGGEPWQIPARLRYRVQSGRAMWWFDLYRADRVFDQAFNEACKKATEETALPLFKGTPEA